MVMVRAQCNNKHQHITNPKTTTATTILTFFSLLQSQKCHQNLMQTIKNIITAKFHSQSNGES